jgi:hypothetical protein
MQCSVISAWIAQMIYRRATAWTAGVRFQAGQNNFLYFTESGPALRPTQPFSSIGRLFPSLPTWLHGVMLN